MKKFLYPAVLIFTASCSTPTTKVETNAANKNNAPVSRINSAENASNQAIVAPVNQTKTDAISAVNASSANELQVENLGTVSRRNLERLKSKGGGNANAAPIPAIKPTPNAAPDNSEISSQMNEKGTPVETRVFKNHPLLLKIEKSLADINNPVIKVYLKNGKVLIAPKRKISDTVNASANEILQAVGVKP